MSAETDYLRGQLGSIRTSINNESKRREVIAAIDSGLALLNARDVQEAQGIDNGDLDATVIANLYNAISGKVTAFNNHSVSIPALTDIMTGLQAAGGA